MASRGTVGCYLRELNIDELAGPIPEYVTHVLYGLEPHDPKNLLCRTEAQISAPLPRSFPSQLWSFSFTILQKWLNIPPNIITTCVQNIPFWRIFQKKSPVGETTPWPLATYERERKWNRTAFMTFRIKCFIWNSNWTFERTLRSGVRFPVSPLRFQWLVISCSNAFGIWPKDR